jgi:hypothetical protein
VSKRLRLRDLKPSDLIARLRAEATVTLRLCGRMQAALATGEREGHETWASITAEAEDAARFYLQPALLALTGAEHKEILLKGHKAARSQQAVLRKVARHMGSVYGYPGLGDDDN